MISLCDSERPEENAKTRRGENANGRRFCRAPFPFHFAPSLEGFPLAGYFAFSPAFAGSFRLPERTELLHQAQVVLVDPDLRDLAAGEDKDVQALVFDLIAGRRHPEEGAVVRALDEPARGGSIALAGKTLDHELDI